jgi:hypothetical protein
MARIVFLLFFVMLLNSLDAASQLRLTGKADSLRAPISIRVLPQNFYNTTLSFVCKKELAMQKKLSLPLFIRLGSKAEVDRLEGKYDFEKMPQRLKDTKEH